MADNEAKIVLSARDKTKLAFDSAKKSLGELKESAEGIGAKFGTLGVAIAGAFEAASLKEVIEIGDQLNKLSQKTGITVDALSSLGYAGKLADVGLDDLATGLKKLGNGMADAAGGSKQAQAVFDTLGIKVKNARGQLKGTDDVLGEIADKFAGYEDGAGKAALATEIFGKNGASLIPLLNQGSEGLRKSREEAEKFGIVIGPEFAEQSERFNDNLTKINESLKASKIRIAEELLPTLNELSEQFLETRKAGQDSLIGEALRTGLEAVAVLGINVGYVLKGVGTELGALAAQAVAFLSGNFSGFSAIGDAVREDAERARKEVDALSERILSVGRKNKDEGAFESGFVGSSALSGKKKAPVINKDAEAAASAYDALIKKIKERGSAEAAEADLRRKLNDGEKFGLDVVTELGLANSKLTNEQKRRAAAELEQVLQLAKGNEERKRREEADKEALEATQKSIAALLKEGDARKQSNQSLADQIEEIGLTAEKLEDLRIARLEVAKATEAQALSSFELSEDERAVIQRNLDLLQQQIDLRRRSKAANDREANDPQRGGQRALDDYIDTAKKAGDATEALTKRATQGLEDGLTAALTGGKFQVKNFVNEILAEIIRLQVVRPLLASIFGGGGVGGLQALFSQTSAGSSGFGTGAAYGNQDFGGFFADGGRLGAGKWGIAGEAGPEVVRGPAQIVPMGAGGGGTIVQNNYIDSRTDASSVAQIAAQAANQAVRQYHAARVAQGATV